MVLGSKKGAFPMTGMVVPNAFTSFDPATKEYSRSVFNVVGIGELGHHYPFNRGATGTTPLTTSTLSAFRNEYQTFEITASNTITCGVSPIFIAARKVIINTGAVLDADGAVGSGGAGGLYTGPVDSVAGQGGDLGNSNLNYPPQFHYGLASGGAGGPSGSSNGGSSGGRGHYGLAGGVGGATAGGTGGAGSDYDVGAPFLGRLLEVLKASRGGAGGGGGNYQSGANDGGDGGAGGGIILIVCEEFQNLGTIRARGTAGESTGSNGGGGGGGGGGMVLVMCHRRIAAGTIQVTGGAGGTGGGTGGAGGDGLSHIEYVYGS